MVNDVSDRRFDTSFVKDKTKLYKHNIFNADKSGVKFDLDILAEATRRHVGGTMSEKKGDGLIFVNCMEKLTMNGPRETLQVRMASALDAGVDGITLSAGLHLGSFGLIADHPGFAMPSWASLCRVCGRCSCFCARTRGLTASPTM